MSEKDFIVVAYDISDDSTRTKVCNALKNYGNHVQLSVFECVLKEREYERMKKEVKELIDEKVDLVRFYRICKSCVARSELLGEGSFTQDCDIYMI